jgi:hypothetical protein
MNLNELKQLWASPENNPGADSKRAFLASAMTAIQRDRNQARGMLIYVLGMTGAMTAFSAWQLFSARGEGVEAWYAHLMIAATWIAALGLARHYRRRTESAPLAGANSIRDTLESLHERASTRCRESKILLVLYAVFIPLLAIAIQQLQANGKMRPHEASSAATLAGIIVLGGIGWSLFELYARRRPELRHLESLLSEYKA